MKAQNFDSEWVKQWLVRPLRDFADNERALRC